MQLHYCRKWFPGFKPIAIFHCLQNCWCGNKKPIGIVECKSTIPETLCKMFDKPYCRGEIMIHVILAVIVAFCAIAYMVRLAAGWQPSNRDVMMVLCWILFWVLSLAISPHVKELSNTSHNTQRNVTVEK